MVYILSEADQKQESFGGVESVDTIRVVQRALQTLSKQLWSCHYEIVTRDQRDGSQVKDYEKPPKAVQSPK